MWRTRKRFLSRAFAQGGDSSCKKISRRLSAAVVVSSTRNIVGDAHASKWSAAGKLLASGTAMTGIFIDAKVKRVAREAPSIQAVTEVSKENELSDVPYWNQGNAELYSCEALRARFGLRQHPKLKMILHKWWTMLVFSTHASREPISTEVEKQDYCRLLLLIYKALLNPFNQAEAETSAEKDWQADSKGHDVLGSELFMDAM